MGSAVAGMHPAYAAVVMATGIVSTAFAAFGFSLLSTLLLVITLAVFAVLLAAYLWRFIRYPPRVAADARDPARGFGYFTLVAAFNVVGVRLALAHLLPASEVLAVVGAALWLVVSYAVLGALVAENRPGPVLSQANGSWFLLVVSTQSLTAAAATIAAGDATLTAVLAPVAVALWGIGVVQYLVLAGLLIVPLLDASLPSALSPTYWIYMGATAITVLGAARILALPADLPVLAATRQVVSGLGFVLWAFGTWWIPLLLVFTVRRHLPGVVAPRPTYVPALWSVAFPLGMYAVATDAFGRAIGTGFLIDIAWVGMWVGLAVWLAVAAIMIGSLAGPRRTADRTADRQDDNPPVE